MNWRQAVPVAIVLRGWPLQFVWRSVHSMFDHSFTIARAALCCQPLNLWRNQFVFQMPLPPLASLWRH